MTKVKLNLSLLALLAWSGCDDAPAAKEPPTFEEPDAGETGSDEGDAGDAGEPARTGPQYAVVSSDYMATSISLLGESGDLLADDYINSGSARAGLVTALSGDVELPTQSNDPGVLVIIDRYKTDVITRIRLSDAKVLGQVKTHTPATQDTTNAYTSNPHDYIRIDDHTAWVSRNQPNLDPGVPELERGNDLLRIDPSKMERTEERIDLSSLNTKGTRTNPDTKKEEEVDVYAKPSRFARVGDLLIVGLSRTAIDFTANGSGMVALVNLQTKTVQGLEFPDFIGCVKVAPIPNDAERVLVSCLGDYTDVRGTAGHAIVRVQKGKANVELTWRLQDHTEVPELAGSSVALGGTLIGAASTEYAPGSDSVFGLLDLRSSAFTQLANIPGGEGTFGTPLYDLASELLFVPDARADKDMRPTAGLHIYEHSGDKFSERELLKVAEDTAMPVRHIYPL